MKHFSLGKGNAPASELLPARIHIGFKAAFTVEAVVLCFLAFARERFKRTT